MKAGESPKYLALARTFPTLRYADGLVSQGGSEWFDPDLLDAWAASASRSSGTRNAARFVLHVFDSRRPWKCGRFDIFAARASWDSEHRKAFLDWFQNG